MVVASRFIKSKPYLLIDGSNLLMRLLYVRQKNSNLLSTPELIVSVSQWFVHQVATLARDNNCSGLLVAMDLGGSIRKKALYKDYKAHRNISTASPLDTPEKSAEKSDKQNFMAEVYPQLRLAVVDLCRSFNLQVFFEYGIEADDILGLVAENMNSIGKDVVLVSNDTDFLQLCSMPNVTCVVPSKKAVVDMNSFPTFFEASNKLYNGVKIHASEYIFYKSLVGDKSDNIIGIKGVGYKTLHKLKEQYFTDHPNEAALLSIDQVDFINRATTLPNNHSFEKLILSNHDTILLNYKLIDLTSRYASATLITDSFKIVRQAPAARPKMADVIKECKNIFSVAPSLSTLTESLGRLSQIYS